VKEVLKLLGVEFYKSDSFFLADEFLLEGINTLLETSIETVLLDFFKGSLSESFPSWPSGTISTLTSSILL